MTKPKTKQQPNLTGASAETKVVIGARLTKVKHVIGLDTATDRWHAFSWDPKYRMHCHLTGKQWQNPDDRRHALYLSAQTYFARLPAATLVVCEEPLGISKNGKTTRLLGMAAGAIWAAHLHTRVFWVWADIAAWKKQVIGNGNAAKDDIREWAIPLLGPNDHAADNYDSEPDYYDAMGLAVYGRMCLDDPS